MSREPGAHLTARQREVWRLVARGHTNGEIAKMLGISLDGAKWHVGELLNRLGASSRDELMDLWDAQRTPAARIRSGLGALAGGWWWKAAGGAAAAGGIAMGSVLFASMGSSEDTNAPPTPAAASATPDSGLTNVQALQRAEDIANQMLAAHLQEYLSPGFDVSGLRLVESERLEAGTTKQTYDRYYSWVPSTATPAVWAFSWVGVGVATVSSPLAATGDVLLTAIFEDTAGAAVLAEQAQVYTRPGGWVLGHVSGLESLLPAVTDQRLPLSEVFEVTPDDGRTGPIRVFIYRDEQRGLCSLLLDNGGQSAPRCGGFGVPDPEAPISIVTIGGSGPREGRPVPWHHTILMRTRPDARWLAVQSADGSEDRFPTMAIPSELRLPHRVAIVSTARLDNEHTFVLYDQDGQELFRSGPWTPDNSVPPYSNRPGVTPP